MQTTTPAGVDSPSIVKTLELDSHDPFTLSIATPAHTAMINELRQKAYTMAGYFSLPDPRTVRRDTDAPHAIVFVIANKRSLAATVRMTYAKDRKNAERILEGTADVPPSYFPCVTMCRGATDPKYRGLGLMAFLVSLGVASARRAGLGSALGVQYDGTPHFRAMNAAGWDRKPIADQMSTVKGNAGLGLVYIGRERFETSVRHSERVHAQLHQVFEVDRVVRDAVEQIAKQR